MNGGRAAVLRTWLVRQIKKSLGPRIFGFRKETFVTKNIERNTVINNASLSRRAVEHATHYLCIIIFIAFRALLRVRSSTYSTYTRFTIIYIYITLTEITVHADARYTLVSQISTAIERVVRNLWKCIPFTRVSVVDVTPYTNGKIIRFPSITGRAPFETFHVARLPDDIVPTNIQFSNLSPLRQRRRRHY